jgi:hypothetical protein
VCGRKATILSFFSFFFVVALVYRLMMMIMIIILIIIIITTTTFIMTTTTFTITLTTTTTITPSPLSFCTQTILEDTDPGINDFMRACFYDDRVRDCNELFYVTYWSMKRCYTLNVSTLDEATATTSLQIVIDVNQDGYVLQSDKSIGVKVGLFS